MAAWSTYSGVRNVRKSAHSQEHVLSQHLTCEDDANSIHKRREKLHELIDDEEHRAEPKHREYHRGLSEKHFTSMMPTPYSGNEHEGGHGADELGGVLEELAW